MGVSLNPSARYSHDIVDGDLVLPVTVCGWVRIDTDRNNFTSICWLGDDVSNDHAVFFACGADGTTLTLYDSNFDGDVTGSSMTVGTWYFVAATANTGAGNFRLYQATELGSLSMVDSAAYSGTFDGEALFFGYRTSGVADSLSLDGSLAYWRVWTAELSQAELASEMASATPVRSTNLWGAWAFTDAATATTDASGNGHTLTLATGGGSVVDTGNPNLATGTATPAVIARSFTLPAVTPVAGSVATPATIAAAAAIPSPGAAAGAGPAVIARPFVLPAVAASGGGSASATPTVIGLAAGLPAVTPSSGATVAAAVLALAVTTPAVAASSATDATVTPAAVALAFALPLAAATGVLDFAEIVALHHDGLRPRHRVVGELEPRVYVKGHLLMATKPSGSTEDFEAPRLVAPTDPTAQAIAFGFTTSDTAEPDTFYAGTWDGAGVLLSNGTWAGRPITPLIGPAGVVDLPEGRHRVWLRYAGLVRRRIGSLTVT